MIPFFKNISRKVKVTDTTLLVVILLTGAFLRFWRLCDIPFTYDEFSAIFRTQFDTFHELIEKGVKIDTHPAGIQVFLFYLVKIFGVSEAALKTPFIIFGLLSVWLVYLIGKDWFSSTAGLVAASFVSFLQFPVMYSQIARPYASGLFFCMLMVYFWTKVLFHPQRKYYQNLAGYVLAGALCVYNHHFSLLFAAIVGITGLFVCPRKNMWSYILAGALVIILYIPHLPIFFAQLGMGGVEGWLHKPRYDFIFDFIQYIFQFSLSVYMLVLLMIILELAWHEKSQPARRKFFLISLIWFLVPYLIGFFYSRYVNAVLQYSVLIFSFPFLLFILFGYFNTGKLQHKVILVFLTALVVIPSLIAGRQHYRIFYKSLFREIVAEPKQLLDSLGPGNCMVILDAKKEIIDWYLGRFNCKDLPFRYVSSFRGKRDLQAWLRQSKTNYLALGCISLSDVVNYPLILEEYPFLVKHKTYAGGDFYLFSRTRRPENLNEYFYKAVNTFEAPAPEWGWIDSTRCIDSLALDGEKSYAVTNGSEFGPSFSMPLRPMIHNQNDVVDVSVDMLLPQVFPSGWLVVTVTSGKKNIQWNSAPVSDFISPGQKGRVFISLKISDVEMRHHRLMLTSYIWNPGKLNYIMDNFTVRVRRGNPVVYGIIRAVNSGQ
jgi:hypothetical protein